MLNKVVALLFLAVFLFAISLPSCAALVVEENESAVSCLIIDEEKEKDFELLLPFWSACYKPQAISSIAPRVLNYVVGHYHSVYLLIFSPPPEI